MSETEVLAQNKFSLQEALLVACQQQTSTIMLENWRVLAEQTSSFSDFYARLRSEPRLDYLTLDVTPACDLTCPQSCYYHPDIDTSTRALSVDVVVEAVEQAQIHLALGSVVLAGKEPLLHPQRLFALLSRLRKSPGARYGVGLITNGRRLVRHWDALTASVDRGELDFLDVSIDSGIASEHDQIRGKAGTFDLAYNAVMRAERAFPSVRVGISSVLFANNEVGLLGLISMASKQIANFFIIPLQPPPYSLLQPIKPSTVCSFVHNVISLLETLPSNARQLEVSVALNGFYISDMVAARLFGWAEITESPTGQMYVRRQYGRHQLIFVLSVLPEQAWRLARILHDGSYLAHLHFLQAPQPQQFAVGNISTTAITDLYARSLAPGSYFQKILNAREDHDCRSQPCWTSCFGGWTAAENSFLTGDPLTSLPSHCRKGR